MTDTNIKLQNIVPQTSITAIPPFKDKMQETFVKKSFKDRLKFGLMYQHPMFYNVTMWIADPNKLILKSLAKNIAGQSVLDLGCGTASLQSHLPKDVEYVGIDLNSDFLRFAEKKGLGVFYKRNVLEDLSDFKADTVVLSDILHHITPNHQKLIDNAKCCARKKVVISECYEKEGGPFKRVSEFISRRLMDNDGLNAQRASAGWLTLQELLEFLSINGATNFQKILSHIHCEINIQR